MKKLVIPVTLLFSAGIAAVLTSPARAEWIVEKNETDPFDSSKSTFVAILVFPGGVIAVRCLSGGPSLALIVGPSNSAVAGETVSLKIVADAKPVRVEHAEIVTADHLSTTVQFGDDETLNYLKAVNKVSVRYTIGDATVTDSFPGGKMLTTMVGKALKACGLDQTSAAPVIAAPAPPAAAAPAALAPSPDAVIQFPPYKFTDADRQALVAARLKERFCASGGKVDELMAGMVAHTTAFNRSDIPAAKKIADAANMITPSAAKSVVKCP